MIFITMLTKEYFIRFRVSYFYIKLKKLRQPYLFQLFTYAAPITTLVEPNQMMLGFLIDQSQSGRGQIMLLEADAICLFTM